MRVRWIGAMVMAFVLAACGGPTATPEVLGTPVSLPTVTAVVVEPSATAAPTDAPPVVTEFAEATATPEGVTEAEAAIDTVLGDPLLRAYRVMVAMQVNATFLADAAEATVAGEMEGDDIAVSALVFGALTQAVDEDVPGVAAPPELANAWTAALAAHEAIKGVSGQWLLGQLTAAQAGAALAPLQADLEAALVEADGVVAAGYFVQAASLTQYRARLTLAMEALFE